MSYDTLFGQNRKPVHNNQSTPSVPMVRNDGGGFSWAVDNWTRLERFLILGSEGGSFYIKPQELTKQNATSVIACINADGARTVKAIVDVSLAGRASSNDPALFALALAASYGDDDTRKRALDALPQVARTGTHLYHFAKFVTPLRGWGRGLRNAVGGWFTDKTPDKLAYQLTKYQQRDGWSASDLLRLAHPRTGNPQHNAVFQYVLRGYANSPEQLPSIITGVEAIKRATSVKEVVQLITDYRLDREMVPTQWLNETKVWEALLAKGMPIEAMTRNLAKMTSLKMMDDDSVRAVIIDALGNQEQITRSRLHPMKLLKAYKVYSAGKGVKGSLVWTPNRDVRDALDEAFYLSFGNVPSTCKKMLLALDVSGSMGAPISGDTEPNAYGWYGYQSEPHQISCAEGAAVMAMVTKRVERNARVMAFSGSFVELDISPRDRLEDVLKKTTNVNFGSTNCSLPMIWAQQNNFAAEGIAVYTDSDTNSNRTSPDTELNKLRNQYGIASKLVVVGMNSNGFTIANPNDKGQMDVVGFDTSTPQVIGQFFN